MSAEAKVIPEKRKGSVKIWELDSDKRVFERHFSNESDTNESLDSLGPFCIFPIFLNLVTAILRTY